MSRNVLITGAGGFVGSHLAAGFALLGDTVTAFDQAFDAPTRKRLAALDCVEAPLNIDNLQRLGRFDLVIHGAALTTAPQDLGVSDAAHIKTNMDLLLDCLGFAQGSSASHFVFISSSGVFDNADAQGVLRETTPARGRAPYAVAKRAGEMVVDAAVSERFSAFSIRLGPIYGPYEARRETRIHVSQVRRWLDRAQLGQPIVVTSPDTRRDWTFAPDLAPALDAVLRRKPAMTGALHFTSGEVVQELDLARQIAALVSGVQVQVAPDGLPERLPMTSMLDFLQWTPLASGLQHILIEEAQS